jgi:hypothetical protein
MDPIIVAIIIIVFVAIIIIGIVLFVVVNKRKHKPIPADILADVAKINALRVVHKPFKLSKIIGSEKIGSSENGDDYVNKLYDKYIDFISEQVVGKTLTLETMNIHQKELEDENYNNVLNYVIRTEYNSETDPDPLERLVPIIKKMGLYVSKSPSSDDTDEYDYDFYGYDSAQIHIPVLSIIYTDVGIDNMIIDNNSNIYIDITLELSDDGVEYAITPSDDHRQKIIHDYFDFPIYIENQTDLLEAIKMFNNIWFKHKNDHIKYQIKKV